LLAELALARLPGLIVHQRQDRPQSDLPFDFLVTTEHGFCFFVEARAFSSFHLHLRHVERAEEWGCPIDPDLLRRARESFSPVLLFLFDADTDHGRYARLDTLPAPDAGAGPLEIRFPKEAALHKESLQQLIDALPAAQRTSA
jgi:hypothetical protein